MSTVVTQPTTPAPLEQHPVTVVVYSHSPIFYWWPVWVLGYVFAILTYAQGVPIQVGEGDIPVLMHPSRNLGVVYTIVFLLIILMTHLSVRGLASVTLVISILAITILFAYLGIWEDIFRALGSLAIYMNLGFYVFFSTAMLIVWLVEMFIIARLDYWTFHPGQAIHHRIFGAGEQTYDTRGMSVEKMRDDLFRHWVLGLGSGDLRIVTTGAVKADFLIPNVLFVGGKVDPIQRLSAMKPDETLARPA